jgi:8-oxo-dGTP diphosphatase
MRDIMSAGGIVWRTFDGVPNIGLVGRPRYGGDTALPKGKLHRAESLRECAIREVAEELGVEAEITGFAGATTYPMEGRDKYVLMFEMQYVRDLDDGPDGVEITSRQWLPADDALDALTYETEKAILRSVLSRRRP